MEFSTGAHPYPSPHEGGDADTAFSPKIVKFGVFWRYHQIPLPLVGRG
jgi:hypothetical protein